MTAGAGGNEGEEEREVRERQAQREEGNPRGWLVRGRGFAGQSASGI